MVKVSGSGPRLLSPSLLPHLSVLSCFSLLDSSPSLLLHIRQLFITQRGHSGLPAGSPLHNTTSAKKHKPRQPYSTENKIKYLRLKLFLDNNRRCEATSTLCLAFLWYVRFFHTAVLYLRAVDVELKPTCKRHARLLLNTVAWISGRDSGLTLQLVS